MTTTYTGPAPADFTDVRATNLAVVLDYVRTNAPCSRADIAASTGLNKATVSSLVGELIERRLLRETGMTERRIGRPATMIVLDGAPYAAIGLDVGTDQLTVIAVDLGGEHLLAWRRAFTGRGATPGRSVAAIAALARRALGRLADQGRQVLGLTVGVGGLVDPDGVVRIATGLDWRDVPLRDSLVRALGAPDYPVTVDNSANLAVLAEHRYGPYAGTPDLAYLTSGPGVSAGIVAGGRLLRGAGGYAGEIGHFVVDPGGPECSCGRRGCLEAVAGVGALIRRLAGTEPAGDLEPEVAGIVRRARAQEPKTLAALHEAGRHLGHGASLLANLVNPSVVILGGHYVPLAPWILPTAGEALDTLVVAPQPPGAGLVASALGHDAAAVGGAAAVLDAVEAGRLPLPTA
ncbi:ROK family transcriptional regulator [Rugosimonospora africana]|uniref:Transcriptional regulator n=1 Tax=Rugosimonospora africana TaxID=556532 RepID=A0A8J3R0Y9_9ACTN|nr:ROK family transcriptional regulator [Rugosimonospora africana]GIH20985.1 transcriptional regulator [Rugosimonospora africana]